MADSGSYSCCRHPGWQTVSWRVGGEPAIRGLGGGAAHRTDV